MVRAVNIKDIINITSLYIRKAERLKVSSSSHNQSDLAINYQAFTVTKHFAGRDQ